LNPVKPKAENEGKRKEAEGPVFGSWARGKKGGRRYKVRVRKNEGKAALGMGAGGKKSLAYRKKKKKKRKNLSSSQRKKRGLPDDNARLGALKKKKETGVAKRAGTKRRGGLLPPWKNLFV